jgi:KaiC/GvpD/RAD55 family RecA-like ATPase
MEEKSYLFLKDKVPTGLFDLDVITEGGYQKGSTIALLGPPGMEKAILGMHLMSSFHSVNNYVLLDMPPLEAIKKSKEYNIKLNVNKFIDMYSVQAGIQPNRERDLVIDGFTALNDLSLELSRLLNSGAKDPMAFYFHSFSTLLLNNQFDSLMKFYQVTSGRIKGSGGIMMMLFEEALHDKTQLSILLRSMDITVRINPLQKGKWEMSISGVESPIYFTIDPEGIDII